MDEGKIKNILKTQQELVNDAKRMADRGFAEKSIEFLVKARICKDAVYSLLMEAEPDERGLIRVTKKILDNMQKNADHYYAKETQKVYSEGCNYCEKKLNDWEVTKLMN